MSFNIKTYKHIILKLAKARHKENGLGQWFCPTVVTSTKLHSLEKWELAGMQCWKSTQNVTYLLSESHFRWNKEKNHRFMKGGVIL